MRSSLPALVRLPILLALASTGLAQDAVESVPADYYEQPDPFGVWLPVAGLVLIFLAIWLPMRRTRRMDRHAERQIEADRAAAAEALSRP